MHWVAPVLPVSQLRHEGAQHLPPALRVWPPLHDVHMVELPKHEAHEPWQAWHVFWAVRNSLAAQDVHWL